MQILYARVYGAMVSYSQGTASSLLSLSLGRVSLRQFIGTVAGGKGDHVPFLDDDATLELCPSGGARVYMGGSAEVSHPTEQV